MIDKKRVTVVRSLILRLLVLLVGLACGGQVCAYDFKAETPDGVVIYYDINGKDATVTSGDKEYAGDVKIPSKVEHAGVAYDITAIGQDAFFKCENLKSIFIPECVTSIGDRAFCGCNGLTALSFNEGLKSIGYYAFSDCNKLTSIWIPANITNIQYGAFAANSSLKEIVVDEKNKVYDSREGCNAIIETSTNKLIEGCQTTRIPNSVTAIGYGAFSHCETLKSLVIPESVSSIGIHAFYSCNNLDTVVSMVKKPFSITSDVFYSIGKTAKLYVPEGTKKAYTSLEGWNSHFAEIIVNPSTNSGL